MNLKVKKSKAPGPWAKQLEADAKKLFESLESQKWDPEHALSLFKGPLSDVISSLEFNSHHRWGLQADAEEIRHLSKEFLQWMESTQRWEDWRVAAKEFSGTWPVRFFLARDYLRFKKERKETHLSESKNYRLAQRNAGNLSRLNELGENLSEQMLEAFSGLTQKLPKAIRLFYELHLDGLLNNEIAWLMDVEETAVAQGIAEAKEFLSDFASEGETSREGN
jgi:hypothetical protein